MPILGLFAHVIGFPYRSGMTSLREGGSVYGYVGLRTIVIERASTTTFLVI